MSESAGTDLRLADAARQGHSVCWHCETEVDSGPICPSCVKIQPLGRTSDYFSVMGLPRKLTIDARVLEPVFHALSRRFHPDMYRLASSRERLIALDNSAVLNQAYRTLRDPFERAAYLVQLEEGRGAEVPSAPPAELFEEILEVQELLAELKLAGPDGQESLRAELQARRAGLKEVQDNLAARLKGELFAQWDALPDGAHAGAAEKAAVLAEIRRALGERSYLRRVLDSLDQALAG